VPSIKLNRCTVIVDERDVALARAPGWFFDGNYVRRHRPGSGHIGTTDLLHRLIMDAPSGVQVDHRNGRTLDNRRANLRLASLSLQRFNSKIRRDNSSGHVGVYMRTYATCVRWLAYGRTSNKTRYLGSFPSLLEAVAARTKWERAAFGEVHRSRTSKERCA